MRTFICAAVLIASVAVSRATLVVTAWTPLFKGIDHSAGTNYPDATIPCLQVTHCLRIDLYDPDLQLFATPKASAYVAETRETLSLSITNFIKNFGVQVATDANFYTANPGGSDPTSEGVACEVYGLLISTGQVVSVADNGDRYASLMFTTNKTPILNLDNRPPGTNTTGIYTAVTGYYPVLTNGVNIWDLYYNDFFNIYPDFNIHSQQPRTAFGLSQDNRYLFMMTIDGRQPGYSDGAYDWETAIWLLQFGAWNAINMDGGGSTAMYMADCVGNPLPLNHSSLLAARGRERIIGSHLGVHAKPLPEFISNISAVAGQTTASITWTTVSPASSQVDYGVTPSYGTFSTFDPTPTTSHTVTLTGLTPSTRYFYQVLSSDGTTDYSSGCALPFTTTNNLSGGLIFDLMYDWKYSTANLDGINWTAPGYNDSSWSDGPGLLWADTRGPNSTVPLETTQLPVDSSTTYPFITYYFRSHFQYTNRLIGATLIFSNYIDDGAAFYLNGAEINRAYLPSPAVNSTLATGVNCATSDATCPYVFTTTSNLLSGDNVLAVEVHNSSARSPDVTFGQALFYTIPPPPPPPFIANVVVTPGETSALFTWTTISNSTSRVAYGLTTNLSKATPTDFTMVTNHSVTVTGLVQLTSYFFRVISSVGASQYNFNGAFSTVPFYVPLVSLTNVWSYNTNNLDGVNWSSPDYDESLFLGQGPALLYIETNAAVFPRNTLLPPADGGLPFPTYYFRTHFSFDTNLAGLSLIFTNYIDDGAIFYLNGTEIQRVRMPAAPQLISYSDATADCPPVNCEAVNSAPDIFRISTVLLTNLLMGADNVLAAEVHQNPADRSDIVFGSAVGLVRALVFETKLSISLSGNVATIAWPGSGFTLQQAQLVGGSNSWSDVAGPIKTSPYSVTNPPASTFYRLRN